MSSYSEAAAARFALLSNVAKPFNGGAMPRLAAVIDIFTMGTNIADSADPVTEYGDSDFAHVVGSFGGLAGSTVRLDTPERMMDIGGYPIDHYGGAVLSSTWVVMVIADAKQVIEIETDKETKMNRYKMREDRQALFSLMREQVNNNELDPAGAQYLLLVSAELLRTNKPVMQGGVYGWWMTKPEDALEIIHDVLPRSRTSTHILENKVWLAASIGEWSAIYEGGV